MTTEMSKQKQYEEEQAEIAFPTVMWEPGDEPTFFKADALFIHAHPDDESLDFGVLISRFTRAGKRVVVVLLTDGDSGLDQYPQRMLGAIGIPDPVICIKQTAFIIVHFSIKRTVIATAF